MSSLAKNTKATVIPVLRYRNALDRQFSSRSITPASLRSSLERLATLQGELRRAHLETHLEQAALLSDAQIAAYAKLRGYGGSGDHSSHGARHR